MSVWQHFRMWHAASVTFALAYVRAVLFATSAVACGFHSAALAQLGPSGPPPVTVAKPIVKPVTEFDDFIGRFDAVEQVDVRARVGGYVDKIAFVDGSMVSAGDVLFVIDPRPYQAALDQANAALASVQARLEFAHTDLDRAENLKKTGNIAEQIYDQRRQAEAAAKADLQSAAAAIDTAKLNLEYTTVRAPISGRISRHLISIGNLVVANETLLTNVVSLDPIDFYFDIDERAYLSYARQGIAGTRPSSRDHANEVKVTLSDEKVPSRIGHMDFVDNKIDNSTGTLRGRAVFENKDLLLTPGLFGRIQVLGSGVHEGVLVPEEALGADQNRRIVYVVGDDNKVTTKAVRLGPRIDGYRLVREGLKGDETIVVNGLMRVRPGAEIKPQMITLPPTSEPAGG
jgi:multidrug efflux system membrane fusion protein